MSQSTGENEEIKIFQEYLRIPSVHPNVNYEPCVHFLQNQAKSLNLPVRVCYPGTKDYPVVVITWQGTQAELPSILLNSHMDVVPVFEGYWTHSPFAAEIDKEGRIYARGAQDMKCVGTQYLGAIRTLQRKRIQLKRTIHIVFVPDEEVGGFNGMKLFVSSDDFKVLNVGFALDEGMASPGQEFSVFYGERFVWAIRFTCVGNSGHSSRFHENAAADKMQSVLEKFLAFQRSEKEKLKNNPDWTLGDVTTMNLTIISGGVQLNVVPAEFTLNFDVRISVTENIEQLERNIYQWCAEAGSDVKVHFLVKCQRIEPTKLDESNPYWIAFKDVLTNELHLKIKPQIFPAATDGRYLRANNIPALGFSPINHTPILLHEHDEYLHAQTYLEGIKIYERLILKIANID